MANTTNFGWETPDDTDLVKDGAAAMRTLGNAIDTSFVDLKGGTTGQNLRKATNTDLDFTWAGDATNTVIDAEGDLLIGDSADTLQRLAIGTTGQVLTVDTAVDGKVKWAAAGGGKVKQVVSVTYTTSTTVSTTTLTDTGLTASITPTSASSKILVLVTQSFYHRHFSSDTAAINLILLRGATTIADYQNQGFAGVFVNGGTTSITTRGVHSFGYLDSPATTSSTTYKTQAAPWSVASSSDAVFQNNNNPSTITLIEVEA